MLEQLMNSLKSEVGGSLSNNPELPQGSIEKIFGTLSDVVKKEVSGQMLSGNLSHVMNLFSKQPNTTQADAIQSNIHSDFIGSLVSKLGISKETATGIAATAVPALINQITKKNSTTPDDDPSPLHELFGKPGSGGIFGAAKNLLGGLLRK